MCPYFNLLAKNIFICLGAEVHINATGIHREAGHWLLSSDVRRGSKPAPEEKNGNSQVLGCGAE